MLAGAPVAVDAEGLALPGAVGRRRGLDAADLLVTPRASPMLIGYGDAQPANLDALASLVLKLSALADDLPEVAVCALWAVAAPSGTHVLAAEIELARPGLRSDVGPRRLRGL